MSKNATIDDCRIIDLRKIQGPRGNLTPIEGGVDVPFAIKRVHWIYDVPGGESRGGVAYKTKEEFIVAMSGYDSSDAIHSMDALCDWTPDLKAMTNIEDPNFNLTSSIYIDK